MNVCELENCESFKFTFVRRDQIFGVALVESKNFKIDYSIH